MGSDPLWTTPRPHDTPCTSAVIWLRRERYFSSRAATLAGALRPPSASGTRRTHRVRPGAGPVHPASSRTGCCSRLQQALSTRTRRPSLPWPRRCARTLPTWMATMRPRTKRRGSKTAALAAAVHLQRRSLGHPPRGAAALPPNRGGPSRTSRGTRLQRCVRACVPPPAWASYSPHDPEGPAFCRSPTARRPSCWAATRWTVHAAATQGVAETRRLKARCQRRARRGQNKCTPGTWWDRGRAVPRPWVHQRQLQLDGLQPGERALACFASRCLAHRDVPLVPSADGCSPACLCASPALPAVQPAHAVRLAAAGASPARHLCGSPHRIADLTPLL